MCRKMEEGECFQLGIGSIMSDTTMRLGDEDEENTGFGNFMSPPIFGKEV